MTSAPTRHLAQINVTTAPVDLDHPNLKDFFSAVQRVNEVAERSEGFVWRYVEPPEGPGIDNLRMLVNMSVWETPEQFEHFVWNTIHKKVYAKKDKWFEAPSKPHFAMWWVAPGETPTVTEGMRRLELLDANGPTEDAFGWESLPNVKLWMSQRCG